MFNISKNSVELLVWDTTMLHNPSILPPTTSVSQHDVPLGLARAKRFKKKKKKSLLSDLYHKQLYQHNRCAKGVHKQEVEETQL